MPLNWTHKISMKFYPTVNGLIYKNISRTLLYYLKRGLSLELKDKLKNSAPKKAVIKEFFWQ